MSTVKTKTAKSTKSGTGKSVLSNAPEPLPPVTPVPAGTDPSTLPFPEWSDQAVNAEKWDLPKSKDKAKQKPAQTPKKTLSSTPAQFPTANNPDEPTQYVDPHLVRLPNSLMVHQWKRPAQVFPNTNFILYKESSEYPDLISGSKHILHSDFMRSFISAVGILEYLGNTRPSPVEFPSSTFFPNTSDVPWKPWHHIYSSCKAGKGQKHNPQVNTLDIPGKYVVRLFWMGCWRRVTIDDLLPVDNSLHILLPSLDKPKDESVSDKLAPVAGINPAPSPVAEKKSKNKQSSTKTSKKESKSSKEKSSKSTEPQVKEIEMWPFLLCKALLKLSSLTSNEDDEVLDFHIIHALTGWILQKLDVAGMDSFDVWEMCTGYCDHYEWPDPNKPPAKLKSKEKKGSQKSGSKKSKDTKSMGSKSKTVPSFLDDSDKSLPFHLIVSCSDMRGVSDGSVPNMAPCWSHEFLVDQTRDIPLVKPDPLPELARWKRFRWLAWAIRQGLWPEQLLIPIKCFKMVSIFKKCAEHVVYHALSQEAMDIMKSVAVIEELALEMGDGKKKKKEKQKDSKKDKSFKSKSSKNSSNKSSKKGKKDVAPPIPPDPSFWGDFNKFGRFLKCLYIFFKPSQFSVHFKITDIAQRLTGKDDKGKTDKAKKGKSKTDTDGPKLIMWENTMSSSRNEPIYLFVDSIDYKPIILNFAQIGNVAALQKCDETTNSETTLIKRFPNVESGCKVKKSLSISCLLVEYDINLTEEFITKLMKPDAPFAYVVVEKYNWGTNGVSDAFAFLNTHGTKSIMMDVEPGRFIFRIWVKSDTSYFINLLSDSELAVGTLEDVLECMSHEPDRLMKMCHDISSSYGQLVQKFGTPLFTERLVTFYKSYLPKNNLSKPQLHKLHDAFMKEFLNSVKENCSELELSITVYALRALFLNPFIKFEKPETPNVEIKINSYIGSASDDVEMEKARERAAVKIQALFKKIYVRKLKILHQAAHKDYMKIFDTLKKVYTNTFGVQKRMLTCASLIRNFLLLNPEMKDLGEHYSLLDDLNSTIILQHFTGNVLINADTWVPVTRQVFHVNSPNSLLVKICLFCSLPKYMIRVFNNDTNQEIKRFTNNVIVSSYENNAAGYTTLCYGWSDSSENMAWKLDFVTLKQKQNSLIITPAFTIHRSVLNQNYNPNVYNIICRCLVNVNRDTLATFRLTADSNVRFVFRCSNEAGQVFSECSANANAILPTVMLKFIPVIDKNPEESVVRKRNSTSSKNRRSSSKLRTGSSESLMRKTSHMSLMKRDRFSDRSSIGKLSSRKSVASIAKSVGLNVSGSSTIRYKDTVYILEAFVLEDSWPLNVDEWDVVSRVKAKKLLGSPEDISKSSKLSASRRSSASSKKSIDGKKVMSELKGTESPSWCLESITDVLDCLVPQVDKRRDEEIIIIKRSWYESNPSRYEMSKKLREQFLESHYMKTESPKASLNSAILASSQSEKSTSLSSAEKLHNRGFQSQNLPQILEIIEEENEMQTQPSCNITIESSIDSVDRNLRTLTKPVSATKMLPPFDIREYYLQPEDVQGTEKTSAGEKEIIQCAEVDEEIDKTVKTPDDEEKLVAQRMQAVEDFENYQLSFEDDMIKFLASQIERFKLLDIFYQGCREESGEMMYDAYTSRNNVIETIIEAEKAKQPPVSAGEKGKKSKTVKGSVKGSKSSKSSKKK